MTLDKHADRTAAREAIGVAIAPMDRMDDPIDITDADLVALERELARHGLAIVRVDARTLEPGDADHPAAQIRKLTEG